MEFIGKIKIQSNKSQRSKKNWLTIGIIMIIIAIMIEIAMGVYYILTLLIPLLWLLRIRSTIASKSLFKDVAIMVNEYNNIISVYIKKSIYTNGMLADRKYTISKSQIKAIKYKPLNGKMILEGKTLEEFLFDVKTLKSTECDEFYFYISNSDFNSLINQYSLENKVLINN